MYLYRGYIFLSACMETKQKFYSRLQTFHVNLAMNLKLKPLLDNLLSEEVITTSEAEKVRGEKERFKQNRCLLNILQTKTPTQIEKFIKGLIITKQLHLAEKIDPSGKNYKNLGNTSNKQMLQYG